MAVSYRLSTRRLGELLLERGTVTQEQLDQALSSRSDPRERLGQTLVRLGILKEGDVVELLAQQFSLPIATANKLSNADPAAVRLVPEHLARQASVLALQRDGDSMEVAVADPKQLGSRFAGDKDVVGLEIEKDDAACMRVGQPLRHLAADPGHAPEERRRTA